MNIWNRWRHKRAFEHGFNVGPFVENLDGVDVEWPPEHAVAFYEGYRMSRETYTNLYNSLSFVYMTPKCAWEASESQVRACKHKMVPQYRTAKFCIKCGFIDWGPHEKD